MVAGIGSAYRVMWHYASWRGRVQLFRFWGGDDDKLYVLRTVYRKWFIATNVCIHALWIDALISLLLHFVLATPDRQFLLWIIFLCGCCSSYSNCFAIPTCRWVFRAAVCTVCRGVFFVLRSDALKWAVDYNCLILWKGTKCKWRWDFEACVTLTLVDLSGNLLCKSAYCLLCGSIIVKLFLPSDKWTWHIPKCLSSILDRVRWQILHPFHVGCASLSLALNTAASPLSSLNFHMYILYVYSGTYILCRYDLVSQKEMMRPPAWFLGLSV